MSALPEEETSYQNYGCVAMNLPADWSRRRYENPASVNFIVGHENGVPDLGLKENPRKRHQFTWVHPNNETDLDLKMDKGYRFVTEKEWFKRETGWHWRDGFCTSQGQRAMYRDEGLYWAEQEEEKRRNEGKERDLDAEANEELAAKAAQSRVAEVTDHEGRPLRPTKRTRS